MSHFPATGASLSIAAGPDGNLWFVNSPGPCCPSGGISRITPAGAVTTFQGTGVDVPVDITAGPDGNLWFTNRGSGSPDIGSIGRITPAGVVTVFKDPAISFPGPIATGADGSIWFGASNGSLSVVRHHNWIGRITPAGAVSKFTDPAIGEIRAIAAGPDGDLWFTNPTFMVLSGGSIGRITPDGVVTTFTDPSINYPLGIAAGPDGNLWFTNYYGNGGGGSIGRMTPAGAFSNFVTTGRPTEIAAGPDGNLWFANNMGGSIGQITPAGAMTTFSDASINHPGPITAGPDGGMWFINDGSIGRVTASAAPAVPSSPASVLAAAGPGHATVSWTPSVPSGGSVTGYTVTSSPGGLTCTWTAGPLSCAVPGLIVGTPYTFRVAATNANGASPPSPPSNTMVPLTGPPFGTIDVLTGLPGGFSVGGWALDPDTSAPTQVAIYVDGLGIGWFPAGRIRPDIAAAFPGYGAEHGYLAMIHATPGPHTVCVYAINVGPGVNPLINCAPVVVPVGSPNPFGTIDGLSGGPGGFNISGWALDPDTAASTQVAVYVDGAGIGWFPAAGYRPDVAAAYPGYGPSHGYWVNIPAAGGTHEVCVYAISIGLGVNSLIGCQAVTVPTGNPFGTIDALTGGPGTFTVAGWAIDPDTASPTQIAVYVDGTGIGWFPAADYRPDLAPAYPPYGPFHSYWVNIPAAGGTHEVCVYAINVGPGTNTLIGCQTVVLPTGNPFGTIDTLTGGPGTFTVAGWAIDPDTASATQIAVYVDGVGISWFPAADYRPDLAPAYPGYGPLHGYSLTIPAASGTRVVCVYAINIGPGANPLIDCRATTVT